MNNIELDYQKVRTICTQIDDDTAEIFNNLMKLSKLVEAIPVNFQDDEINKVCDYLKNDQIISLTKKNEKIKMIKEVLQKILDAYSEFDLYYSQKSIN